MHTAPPGPAERLLLTARLRLAAADERMAPAWLDFRQRNRAHLAPWEPPAEAGLLSLESMAERLRAATAAFTAGTSLRWLLQPIGAPERIIGQITVSQIQRGPFQNGVLGFALDQAYEGQAMMNEALRCVLGEVFGPRVNLHRIQAAYRPENWRSADVLKRLGFQEEGLAADYLFIDGDWRIHRLTALLNPGFIVPQAWRTGPPSPQDPGGAADHRVI